MASQIRGVDNFDSANAGKVLQVISDTHYSSTTQYSTTSTSYIDSELSVTLTPKSSTAKRIIQVSLGAEAPSGQRLSFRVLKDSTALSGDCWDGVSGATHWLAASNTWVDSASVTAATTYKVQVKVSGGTGYYHHQDRVSSIVVTEVEA
jgi:hypothetical protein